MATITDTYTITHVGQSQTERLHVSQPPGGGIDFGVTPYSRSENHGSVRITSPNANYLSKIRDGEIVIGPYQTTGSKNNSYTPASGQVGFYAGVGYTDIVTFNDAPFISYSDVNSALGPYTVDVSGQKVVAATSAQARMLAGAAETAVAWVERYKTLSLLAGSANKLIRVLRFARQSIRSGKGISEIRSFLKEKSFDEALNTWMEVRYGWRPLLYDLANHQQALANILSDTGHYWKSKGSSDYSSVTDVTGVYLGQCSIPVGPGAVLAYGDITAFPKRVGALAGYFYKVDQSSINSELYWLGFQSPVNVIWELVPYSFVVDWFANVGDYLTSVGTMPAFITDPRGFLSTSQTWIVTARANTYTYGAYVPTFDNIQPSGASWETWSFKRELISPGDYVGLRIDVNLNLAKVIDLFVLAKNLAGSNRSETFRKIQATSRV
jgi:hypothetical protein